MSSEEEFEEIDLGEMSSEGLERLFSTLGTEANPQEFIEIEEREELRPSFGHLAEEDAPEPGWSVWDKTPWDGESESPRQSAPNIEANERSEPDPGDKAASFKSSKDLASEAGIDTRQAPTSRWGKALGRMRKDPLLDEPAPDPASEFAKLLRPLSGAEVTLLEKELQADETVFVRIERVRTQASWRQSLGFVAALAVLALWGLLVGSEYLLSTLPDAAKQNWIPSQDLPQDLVGSLVFALGVILPIGAFFAVSRGCRILLLFAAEKSPLAAVGIAEVGLGVSILYALSGGGVLAGLVLFAVYIIFSQAEERIRLRRRR